LKTHSLITTLKSLRGNPRGCVYTEPLWGVPFNLYTPYVSIYMLALGLLDKEIGLIVSISWACQIVVALLSGIITDKLGRRRTTLIFDIISWSVPSLISAVSQNFWYFVVAGIVNSIWRITHNSWTCLLVEDAEPEQLVGIFSWIYIANLVVGLVAPLAGLLIGIYSLVPTMRGLYLFAAVMFTVKAIATYYMTQETAQGVVRMRETQHQNTLSILGEYKGVLQDLLRSPQTLYTAGIMLIVSITLLINNSFWAILVTQKLHIPDQNLAYFPFVKSVIMILFFFVVMPRIGAMHFKMPIVAGFLVFIVSQWLLISAPVDGYGWLLVSIFLEACSFAIVGPLVDRLAALTIDPKERARIQSILYMSIIFFTSPFGWIAGTLSALNKDLPFILNIVLCAIGALLAALAGSASGKKVKMIEVMIES
jgi:DHA1 family tetracycline resistance protein-like MFS transporter